MISRQETKLRTIEFSRGDINFSLFVDKRQKIPKFSFHIERLDEDMFLFDDVSPKEAIKIIDACIEALLRAKEIISSES